MIYIVIPVHNRRELTRRCLSSLLQQDIDDFTIVVVDDGSTDGTSEMIRNEYPRVVLLQGDGNLWWAGSINKGIRHALKSCRTQDFILTLNDDLVVKQDYLASLLAAAQRYPHSIIGSVETTIRDPEKIKSGGYVVNWKTAKEKVLNKGKLLADFPPQYIVEVSKLTGRGTLFPSQVFRDVGLYDDVHIKQCADTELPIRASFKRSYSLYITYEAVVISDVGSKQDINNKKEYSLTDLREYFFGMRSHFNLVDRFWIARSVAPNLFWFFRYLSLNLLRTIGHYVVRLRL